jgi:hypothetical protein
MRKLLLILLPIIVLVVPSLHATTYYVDNCITVGNNSNNGTSTATPWLTVGKVSGSSFSAGDSVLFEKTCTWHEKLTIPSGGSSGNPITYGAYGSGALPTLDGADVISSWTNTSGNVWQSAWTQASNQVIRNGVRAVKEASQVALTANYEWYYNGSNTMFIYTTTNPNSDGSVWEGGNESRYGVIQATDKSYVTVDSLNLINSDETGGSFGLAFTASSGVVSGLTVSNDTFSNNYQYAWQFYNGSFGFNGITLTNLSMDHNFISGGGEAQGYIGAGHAPSNLVQNVTVNNLHASYGGVHGAAGVATVETIGVFFDTCVTCSITNSEVDHNGSTGIIVQNSSNGVTIGGSSTTGNYIHDNGQAHTGDDNGIGVGNIGNGSSNITISYNKILNNYHSSIEVASTDTNQVITNTTISYNILAGSSAGDGQADGLKVGGGHTGQVYTNNLIYGNTDCGYSHTQGTSGDPHVLMYNNTIYGNGSAGSACSTNVYVNGNSLTFKNNVVAESSHLEVTVLSSYTLTSDYNDWYHSAGGNFMSFQGTAGTFAQWKTNSSQDAHSISSSPLFTNAAGNVFTLTSASPLVGAATNLGTTYINSLVPAASWPSSVGTAAQLPSWTIGAYILQPGSQFQ